MYLKALDILCISSDDIFYDLGAGDGRVVIEAAKRGAYGVAVEVDPYLAEVIREKARLNSLTKRIKVLEADLFNVSLSRATVIYAYLYMSVNKRLSAKLEKELAIGTRVATIDFPIPEWIPVKIARVLDEKGVLHSVYLYIIGTSNPKALYKRIYVLDYNYLKRYFVCST